MRHPEGGGEDGGLPAGRFLLSQPHPPNQRAVFTGKPPPEEGGGGGGGNGYDSGHESGGGGAGFEFHGGERALAVGPFQRPIPSKWNDAEKWIAGRQPAHPNLIKKTLMQQRYGGGQPLAGNPGKVAPEGVDPLVADSKRVDSSQMATRFPFGSLTSHPASEPRRGAPRSAAAFSPIVINSAIFPRADPSPAEPPPPVENSGLGMVAHRLG